MRPRPKLTADVEARIVSMYVSQQATANDISKCLRSEGMQVSYSHVLAVLHQHKAVRSAGEALRLSKMKTMRTCLHVRCRQEFVIMNPAQVYCRTCCPSDTKRAYERLKLYGLSHPEFTAMLEVQNNCCALCDDPLRHGGASGLNVDHCHVTGKVRGLVCHKCNMLLGFMDKGEWFNKLQRVANYIANGYYT